MVNRLASASSLYLRQHAEQPVDWWQYGPEAFAEAARRDVPVLLSIGYAACHWCHVMARESFADEKIAAYLNKHFVAIKVDREEHPAVDDTYMSVTQALSGAGGWPMTVFTLPDGRAFQAGTYYPPAPRPGTASFGQLLQAVTEAWSQRRDKIEEQAGLLAGHIEELGGQQRQLLSSSAAPSGAAPGDGLAAAVRLLVEATAETGGLSPAPKFPPTASMQLLWRAVLENPGDLAAFDAAVKTTGAMLTGALRDHLNGGFTRYCVDEEWAVPHFEKMLYDNAQLLSLFTEVAVIAGSHAPEARTQEAAELAVAAEKAARGIVAWFREELQTEHGALASSLNADSPLDGANREGGAYVFTTVQLAEVHAKLSAPPAADLIRARPIEAHTPYQCVSLNRLPQQGEYPGLEDFMSGLRQLAAERPRPTRDDKVVAGWNGLAVAALCDAGIVFQEPEYLRLAAGIAEHLWQLHWDDEHRRLARVSFHAVADHANDGTLEDYAGCTLGLLALAESADRELWAPRAAKLLEASRGFIEADTGLPRETLGADEQLAAQRGRKATVQAFDDALPAPGSLLAQALLASASSLMADEPTDVQPAADQLEEAAKLLRHVEPIAARYPQAVASALHVKHRLDAPFHYLSHTPNVDGELRRLAAVLRVPLREKPSGQSGRPDPGIYPCSFGSCQTPVADTRQLLDWMRR